MSLCLWSNVQDNKSNVTFVTLSNESNVTFTTQHLIDSSNSSHIAQFIINTFPCYFQKSKAI